MTLEEALVAATINAAAALDRPEATAAASSPARCSTPSSSTGRSASWSASARPSIHAVDQARPRGRLTNAGVTPLHLAEPVEPAAPSAPVSTRRHLSAPATLVPVAPIQLIVRLLQPSPADFLAPWPARNHPWRRDCRRNRGAMGAGLLMMVSALPRTRGNTDDERADAFRAPRPARAAGERARAMCRPRRGGFDAVMAVVSAAQGERRGKGRAQGGHRQCDAGRDRGAARDAAPGRGGARGGRNSGGAWATPRPSSDVGCGRGSADCRGASGAAANVRINLDGLGRWKPSSDARTANWRPLLPRAEAAQARARAPQSV